MSIQYFNGTRVVQVISSNSANWSDSKLPQVVFAVLVAKIGRVGHLPQRQRISHGNVLSLKVLKAISTAFRRGRDGVTASAAIFSGYTVPSDEDDVVMLSGGARFPRTVRVKTAVPRSMTHKNRFGRSLVDVHFVLPFLGDVKDCTTNIGRMHRESSGIRYSFRSSSGGVS